MNWETATIDDIFPIRCDKCGTVRPYVAWMEIADELHCPICGSQNGKVLGEFVEEADPLQQTMEHPPQSDVSTELE